MSEPILSAEMREVLRTFPGAYIAAVGDNCCPLITRVVGVEAVDEDRILAYVPQWYSERLLEAAETRPSAALVGVQVTTYRTFQFKGDIVDIRPATEADLAYVASYVDGFGQHLEHVGIDSSRYNPVYASPPIVRVTLRVDSVFDQTPRVGAGNLVKERVSQ